MDGFSFEEARETMTLTGGLDMYAFEFGKRYKEDVSPEGRQVMFLNDNGYDSEREIANRYFTENQILTVKEIYVGRSSSEVEFIGLPYKKFNTVMFADVK